MKLICAADLHLGRVPSRLPDGLGVAPDDLGPAAAWRALVDVAVREGADAVLLAGDVVEDPRDFYEAYADLRRGVARLLDAGVRVFAVSGNHDVDVLPRLADELPGLRLLGRGGRWECAPLEGHGERVRLLGWSFPAVRVTTSPLRDGLGDALASTGHGPAVGLLHGDRDATSGPYAPFRARELRDAGADAWLLGHVHVPDALGAGAPAGYLGSLSACDPGEEGARGAWRLDVDGGRIATTRLPLAPLRYETLRVPVDDVADPADLPGRIVRALRDLHARLAPERAGLRAVGCRLRLVGRTPIGAELRRALHADDPRRAVPQIFDDVRYFVHAWRLDARPAADLARLAGGSDPLGIAARTLLALDGDDPEARRRLVAAARPRLAAVAERPALAPLAAPAPDDEAIAERLRAAALRLLDDLLAQREGTAAP